MERFILCLVLNFLANTYLKKVTLQKYRCDAYISMISPILIKTLLNHGHNEGWNQHSALMTSLLRL